MDQKLAIHLVVGLAFKVVWLSYSVQDLTSVLYKEVLLAIRLGDK